MKSFATIVLVLTSAASAGLLVLSVWPGCIPNIAFFAMLTCILWLPLAGIAGLVILVLTIRMVRRTPRASVPVIVRFFLAGLIGMTSFAVAAFGVPRRIVFPVFSSSFHALVDTAPVSAHRGHELDRRLGIWNVDRFGRDPRGGVYFRTATGPDGIGPDEMSYGFVWKPNRSGSPFGNADYYTARLAGDWYYFHVSDDW